ncbi:hypothetical protein [Treponema socranskii]|uniref:hypothetical protein n=1 Tax=Treponema socranskii TaxID=53419 RepID=UPI003D919117
MRKRKTAAIIREKTLHTRLPKYVRRAIIMPEAQGEVCSASCIDDTSCTPPFKTTERTPRLKRFLRICGH